MARKSKYFAFLLSWLMIGGILILAPIARVSSAAGVSSALEKVIEAARKEGQLDLMVRSSTGEKGARELSAAFNKRFGLNIRVNADLAGMESQKFNQAVTEIKAGIPPTFDLMQGMTDNILGLKGVDGAEQIENWEAFLAQIAPEAYKVRERVSPSILAGYGFLWLTQTRGLIYNSKLISLQELPKTWKDKGDPKYRGAFSVMPFTSLSLSGLLKYDKEELLEIVRSWGRNKRQVLTFAAGVERMMLGELKFLYGNAGYYFGHKAMDPNAPIGLRFFEDLTPTDPVMYVVRKGARHPEAAKLFALWATGAEASDIFNKHSPEVENLVLGKGPNSEAMLNTLKERNIKPVSWFDSPETLEKFRWFETKEGKEYAQAIARAQREGK